MGEVERSRSPSRLARPPIIVGRESELPEPGCFFTHDAAGIALLLTRDAAGKVHAMLNECRHRSARLVLDDKGSAEAFVCKYHAWKYDLGGKLARSGHVLLPVALEQFMDDRSLLDFACETRHGFVWVVPAVRAELDVASWLGELDGMLAEAGLAGHVVFDRSTTAHAVSGDLVMNALLAGAVGSTERSHVLAPSSVLVLRPGSASHVALFPGDLGETAVVHTLLVRRAPATAGESAALTETRRAFEESLERALAAPPTPRE